ncbi:MAG TPA: WecB/TagA/CpsF family glycosyltransferase [bacterium]|nr:WecB/TagA/CpsF family glycosyltransferase [bacterium]HMY35179.1 WecB/TagA/CpsF family glycosyltransferase [bacterium]HMZ03146.1 WecB/TagA/CpsF family glycosyltransferase [bacterium]HNB09570.1 WecB/TagA/CpsF family glycosyltransferase [bacterium]HNB56164.1 WecB/TagA/CpsF family glycosyltransferase [bacterium]
MAKIVGIEFYDQGIHRAVNVILNECKTIQKSNRIVSATDAHGIVRSHSEREFKELLESFYLRLPDGMPTVWVGRIKGHSNMGRCYGPDFFKLVMQTSSTTPVRHFLCGGKQGIAEQLRRVCSDRFGNNHVVGCYSPPFRDMTDEELRDLANQINDTSADIVWIGLGSPKQEYFARRLSGYIGTHFLVTIGAAFDFHTGNIKQAPLWVQKLGLEWFFRLCVEPRRLWKRYLYVVPRFFILGMHDIFIYLLHRRFGRL